MRKKLTVFILLLMIFSMPFLDLSCMKVEGKETQYKIDFGYTLGFPLVYLGFLIDPLRLNGFYPFGLLDFICLLFGFYGYLLIRKKGIRIEPALVSGGKAFFVYITAHFLYNFYYPLHYAYVATKSIWGESGFLEGRLVYALIFPYLYACEKLGLNLNLDKALAFNIRVNMAVAALFYFILGMILGAVFGKFKKKK